MRKLQLCLIASLVLVGVSASAQTRTVKRQDSKTDLRNRTQHKAQLRSRRSVDPSLQRAFQKLDARAAQHKEVMRSLDRLSSLSTQAKSLVVKGQKKATPEQLKVLNKMMLEIPTALSTLNTKSTRKAPWSERSVEWLVRASLREVAFSVAKAQARAGDLGATQNAIRAGEATGFGPISRVRAQRLTKTATKQSRRNAISANWVD